MSHGHGSGYGSGHESDMVQVSDMSRSFGCMYMYIL
jgi:hypothetical protein